jgi:solute carrier family 35 protein F1/2
MIYRQALVILNVLTNIFSTLLVNEGTSIPSFQTFFTYVLLNIIYTSYTLYRYGLQKWCNMVIKDGWKCEMLLMLDPVEIRWSGL